MHLVTNTNLLCCSEIGNIEDEQAEDLMHGVWDEDFTPSDNITGKWIYNEKKKRLLAV